MNAFPNVCQVALKEWAVVVSAMDRGEQVLLLRKGGISEDGKDFRVVHPEFLLYPTFEHQKEELLKESYHDELRHVLSEAENGETITFSHWAKLEEIIEAHGPGKGGYPFPPIHLDGGLCPEAPALETQAPAVHRSAAAVQDGGAGNLCPTRKYTAAASPGWTCPRMWPWGV